MGNHFPDLFLGTTTNMGIETILAVGGAALGAVGSISKGQSAEKAANYNAATDRQRAAEEKDIAGAMTQDYIRKGSDESAAAQAARGATGVTGEGSPLLVDENTVRQIALGASRTLAGGQLRANRLEDDAKLQKMRGESAVTASYLDAGSSLLTAGGKILNPGYGKGNYS